jgi:hypothetical protein
MNTASPHHPTPTPHASPLWRHALAAAARRGFTALAVLGVWATVAGANAWAASASNDKGDLFKADAGEGFHFSHHDWELACDNTRTCRAAGYHPDGDELKVSVLLTREAGAGTPVKGQVMLGQYGDEPAIDALPATFTLTLNIDERAVGKVRMDKDSLVSDLPPPLVAALTRALAHSSQIEFVRGQNRWHLSDQGAAAALLKMDEFQGRLGTPGALLRKGTRSEDSVRPPVPIPTLSQPRLPSAQPTDAQFVARHAKALLSALKNSDPQEECNDIHHAEPEPPEFNATRLTATQMLVSTRCWLAAYNFGYGHWIVNDKPPFQPQLVTTLASDEGSNQLTSSQKGRGLGDCWSSDEWSWNGQRFVHTHSSTSGMCRLMAAGGAWDLPTLVTEVKPAPRP